MLLRFLRANEWVVADAAENVRSYTRFWTDFGMDSFCDHDEYDETGVIFRCGESKFGHPVMVARPCVHVPAGDPKVTDVAVRRSVYSVHRCCCEVDPSVGDGMVVIYDCKGIGLKNMDMKYSRVIAKVLQANFPERVVQILIINNSFAVQSLWNAVKPLLAPETRGKIQMCGCDFEAACTAWISTENPYLKVTFARRPIAYPAPSPTSGSCLQNAAPLRRTL